MANITEELNNPQWAAGIYQLETTDPVLGGPNGIANRQAKELAARTQYLKKKQEEYKPGAASTTKAGIVQLSSATDSSSDELAATPKAVKAAYDKAEEAAQKSLPLGSIVAFPRVVTNPTGFLKADGSSYNQATYPDLYKAMGNSNRLPKLTRSDVGMTAYWPVDAVPDGWIKFDDIAGKVTQSAYPELYRLLVVQYGSIDRVPKAGDRFVRSAAGSLTAGSVQEASIAGHYHPTGLLMSDNDDWSIPRATEYGNKTSMQTNDPVVVVLGESHGGANQINSKLNAALANNQGSGNNRTLTTYTDHLVIEQGGGETRPKAIVLVLCIKAKDSLDDVVYWIKAYGSVSNAGALDAATLAAGLQNKSDKGHTHTTADIAGLTAALDAVVPSGAVAYFAGQSAPNGWLKANGAEVSRTSYASLFAAIGTTFGAGNGSTTFNLPDLRGEFLRGFDDGRGVDGGRVFGSAQADEFKAHNHKLNTNADVPTFGAEAGDPASADDAPTARSTNTFALTSNRGGSETRPRNIAMLACIKI